MTEGILNTPWLFTQLNGDMQAPLRSSTLHNYGFKANGGDPSSCRALVILWIKLN